MSSTENRATFMMDSGGVNVNKSVNEPVTYICGGKFYTFKILENLTDVENAALTLVCYLTAQQ